MRLALPLLIVSVLAGAPAFCAQREALARPLEALGKPLSLPDAAGVLRSLKIKPMRDYPVPSQAFSAYRQDLSETRDELQQIGTLSPDDTVERDLAVHLADRRLAALGQARAAMQSLDPVFAVYRAAWQPGEPGATALRSIPRLAAQAKEAWSSAGAPNTPPSVALAFAEILRQAAGTLGSSPNEKAQGAQALIDLAHAIETRTGQDGRTGAVGPSAYAWLLRYELGADKSPEEISILGEAEMARIKARMTALAQELYPGLELPAALARSEEDHPRDNKSVLRSYEAALERAADFSRSKRLFHGVKGFRLSLAPAYVEKMHPPAPAAYSVAERTIVVTLSKKEPAWLAFHSYSHIPTIAVHEGFPGHGYQSQHPQLNVAFARNRLDLASKPLIEGYGLYVEKLFAEQGFFTQKELLGQLSLELWRAARLIVDTGLHTRRMSADEAVAFLQHEALLPRVVAEQEVNRYLSAPGQALSYFLGYWEIAAMKEAAKAALGPAFTEADFHSALLSFGPLPLPVIARHLVDKMRSSAAAKAP